MELQKELEGLTGELRVPTTIIGDAKLSGYNPAELETVLLDASYRTSHYHGLTSRRQILGTHATIKKAVIPDRFALKSRAAIESG